MTDQVCRSCVQRATEEGWYPFYGVNLVDSRDCAFHPTLTNWRFYRTLATVQHFSAQPPGYRDRRAPTAIVAEGGWVHRRNLECIIFDYEKPMLDLGVAEGLLEQAECDRRVRVVFPRSVRLTAKGDAALAEWVRAGRDAGAANKMGAWVESWNDPLETEAVA